MTSYTKTRFAYTTLALFTYCCGWSQLLTPISVEDPDPGTGMGFGDRVAIAGDYAFVSEPGQLPNRMGEERVHVFHRSEGGANAWGWIQTIIPPDGDGFWFGMGLNAWDEFLAIYRPAHPFDHQGATVCRTHSVFIYRLDENGQWLLDGSIGGHYLNSGPCPFFISSQATDPMYGSGDNLLIYSNPVVGNQHIEFYKKIDADGWVLNFALPETGPACISGDTVFIYGQSGSIRMFHTSGVAIDEIDLGATPSYVSGFNGRTLDVSGPMLAIAQPGGGSSLPDYSAGRVLTYKLSPYAALPCDTITESPSHIFGRSIRMTKDRIIISENGQISHEYRLFIYQLIQNLGPEWTYMSEINVVIEYADDIIFDLSENRFMIHSTKHPFVGGLYTESDVSIWDLNIPVGIAGNDSNLESLEIQRRGSLVHICDKPSAWGSGGQIIISDMTGRIVAAHDPQRACLSGIDLSSLSRGLYVIERRSYQKRASVKLQW